MKSSVYSLFSSLFFRFFHYGVSVPSIDKDTHVSKWDIGRRCSHEVCHIFLPFLLGFPIIYPSSVPEIPEADIHKMEGWEINHVMKSVYYWGLL